MAQLENAFHLGGRTERRTEQARDAVYLQSDPRSERGDQRGHGRELGPGSDLADPRRFPGESEDTPADPAWRTGRLPGDRPFRTLTRFCFPQRPLSANADSDRASRVLAGQRPRIHVHEVTLRWVVGAVSLS